MVKKWEEIKKINIRNEKIEFEDYQEILDEIAEVVYSRLCQLQKNSHSDSLTSKKTDLGRTGTDA